MMKFLFALAMLLTAAVVNANEKQIASPDGKLAVIVSDIN